MSKIKPIKKLTPEQEALLPVYREKWRNFALSSRRINPIEAGKAVRAAYDLSKTQRPKKIFFVESPYAELTKIEDWESEEFAGLKLEPVRILNKIWLGDRVASRLSVEVRKQLESELRVPLYEQINRQFHRALKRQLLNQLLTQQIDSLLITPELWAINGALYDFCISIFKRDVARIDWRWLQKIVQECGWIFPFKDVALVSERPTHISFDDGNLLHAEGEPAIQFSDGFGIHAYHGVTLPEE